jgi:hypothetical protein
MASTTICHGTNEAVFLLQFIMGRLVKDTRCFVVGLNFYLLPVSARSDILWAVTRLSLSGYLPYYASESHGVLASWIANDNIEYARRKVPEIKIYLVSNILVGYIQQRESRAGMRLTKWK